jgi:hypothetical protein
MGEENKPDIVISKFDFGEAPQRSEKDKKIDELVKGVREVASVKAEEAKRLTDYVAAFLLDYRYGSYDGLIWMFDDPDHPEKVEDITSILTESAFIKEAEKTAKIIEEMKDVIDGAPEKEGYSKVTFRQMRSGDFVHGIRVLAEFPSEVLIPHGGFDKQANNTSGEKQFIYYEPSAACFKNPFDDARKLSLANEGPESRVYYLKLVDVNEASENIKHGPNGVAEYILGVDEEGNKIKQSMESYMLVSLLGRGFKEDCRLRVSDFWNREKS